LSNNRDKSWITKALENLVIGKEVCILLVKIVRNE